MAYLPNEQEVRQTSAADSDANEEGSSIGKVMIVVMFFIAVGLLAGAGILQYNNRDRLAQVLPRTSWTDGVILPSEEDPLLVDELSDWEKVSIAQRIAPRVRQFNTYMADSPELFGDRTSEMHRRVPTLVSRLARNELGIRDHQLEMGRGVETREWEPPRTNREMEHLRNRFVTNSYIFTVNGVSREQAVQLALMLEDDFPWITVEQLRIERDRNAPDDRPNVAWSARFGLQWWEERGRTTTEEVSN